MSTWTSLNTAKEILIKKEAESKTPIKFCSLSFNGYFSGYCTKEAKEAIEIDFENCRIRYPEKYFSAKRSSFSISSTVGRGLFKNIFPNFILNKGKGASNTVHSTSFQLVDGYYVADFTGAEICTETK